MKINKNGCGGETSKNEICGSYYKNAKKVGIVFCKKCAYKFFNPTI